MEHCYGIVSGCRSKQVVVIRGKAHAGCSVVRLVHVRGCGADRLQFFKFRSVSRITVAEYIDFVHQLINDIRVFSGFTENDLSRTGFTLTAQDIHQFQAVTLCVQLVHFDLVNAVIDCADIFVVRCRNDTADMRAEVTLCHTAKPLWNTPSIRLPRRPSLWVCTTVTFPS